MRLILNIAILLLKPVLHDASNTFERWPHDNSPHHVAVMHMLSCRISICVRNSIRASYTNIKK